MVYRKLEDCLWIISLKNFENKRVQNFVYEIGRLYFGEKHIEYKKEFNKYYAYKFSLIETIDYLLNLREYLNKIDDIEKYIFLKEIIERKN